MQHFRYGEIEFGRETKRRSRLSLDAFRQIQKDWKGESDIYLFWAANRLTGKGVFGQSGGQRSMYDKQVLCSHFQKKEYGPL